MEAALLMFDVVGMTLVLLWAARGQGNAGLFAWRTNKSANSTKAAGQAPDAIKKD